MIQILFILSVNTTISLQTLTDSIPIKHRKSYATIETTSLHKERGYLYDVDDSTIGLTATLLPKKEALSSNVTVQRYSYSTINTVQLKRHNSSENGALLGALIGIGSGVAIGFISGNDKPDPNRIFPIEYTAAQKALGYGVLFGILGAGLGLIIGSIARKKFAIGGKHQKFEEMKLNLLHRATQTPKS